MYYLQSRYYDPALRRFINADANVNTETGTTLNSNMYAYCENNPITHIDSFGNSMVGLFDDAAATEAYYHSIWEETQRVGERCATKYSGLVGFGIQIMLYSNIGCCQFFVGVEAVWFCFGGANNFGNGFTPWCYFFSGGSIGITLDFDKILSKAFLDSPGDIMNKIGMGISLSISITFFAVTANKMKSPTDYLGAFTFWTGTAMGTTISKASGKTISTYGVGVSYECGLSFSKGFSFERKLFGTTASYSYYYSIPIGRNAASLYNLAKSKV